MARSSHSINSPSLRVAIVGRPNVGKSELFNRLIKSRQAIVYDEPGVTRDLIEHTRLTTAGPITYMDAPGIDLADKQPWAKAQYARMQRELKKVDILLLMIDGSAGITDDDVQAANFCRKLNRPVVLLINKSDINGAEDTLHDAPKLGFKPIFLISAAHGRGLAELEKYLKSKCPEQPFAADIDETATTDDESAVKTSDDRVVRISIIGQPNAGKSTLINALVGEERQLTSDMAGTTRDTITVPFTHSDGQAYELIDTPGWRKNKNRVDDIENLATMLAERRIIASDVVILMVDARAGIEHLDLTLADKVIENGRALVLAVNFMDMMPNKASVQNAISLRKEWSMAQIKDLPIVYISALKKHNLSALMKAVQHVHAQWSTTIATGPLNRWLLQQQEQYPPPLVKGRRIKFRYATQVRNRPPTFKLFVNMPASNVPQPYLRYLQNRMGEDFAVGATPVRFILSHTNPYKDKSLALMADQPRRAAKEKAKQKRLHQARKKPRT